jgi:hypothetical protein
MMTRIEMRGRGGLIVWFWSRARRRWELPLYCARIETALAIAGRAD